MDKHGYPESHELEKIRTWSHANGFVCWTTLLGYVENLWKYSDYFHKPDGASEKLYSISTGGWSGNEEIIEAMKQNTMFWMMCWVSSHRGGHHKFEVKARPVSPQDLKPTG